MAYDKKTWWEAFGQRGGEIVLATRPQFDQTLPSFRSVVASSVKFELPNTRWSSDRPNPPERDARVSSCLLQVENHMVNAARGVTRSRSRASPRARRGGDRTCGRGSVAGETRTPRGARGIARARALCVHRTPETSGRVSTLESREPRAPLSSTSWLGRVSMSRRARARRRDARAGTTNQNGYSLFVSVTPPRHHFRLRDGGPPRQPTRWVLTRLNTLCAVSFRACSRDVACDLGRATDRTVRAARRLRP